MNAKPESCSDPFQSLDIAGVGMLIGWAISAGEPLGRIWRSESAASMAATAECQVLPSSGNGLCQRVTFPSSGCAPCRGTGCDRRKEERKEIRAQKSSRITFTLRRQSLSAPSTAVH